LWFVLGRDFGSADIFVEVLDIGPVVGTGGTIDDVDADLLDFDVGDLSSIKSSPFGVSLSSKAGSIKK